IRVKHCPRSSPHRKRPRMSHLLAKTLAVVVFVALMTTAAATAAWADSPTPTTAPTPPAFSAPAVDSASAQLKNASGQVVGSAQFFQDGQGVVQVKVDVTGLPAGSHGIHIHTVGKCDAPDFTTAGGHFNPGSKKHGLLSTEGPHAGDLPVLTVDARGAGSLQTTTSRISVAAGATSILDSDGSALVIHAAADDQLTDPTGNSGARIACGVIQRVAALPPTGGEPSSGFGIGVVAVLALGFV